MMHRQNNKIPLLAPLLKVLFTIGPIEVDLQKLLTESFEVYKIKKGELLLKEGEVCTNLWFLADGLLRSFHNIGDKEFTSRIMFTNHIVISAGSFFKQTPAPESIEALSNCTLLKLPFIKLQAIYKQYPSFNYHTRLITEDYFYKQEQRLYMLRKPSAEEKYEYFMEHYSEYLGSIPIKHIASFLNIARETFSRLRNIKDK